MAVEEIVDIQSEAGVVSTLICHPEFIHFSDELLPNHFSNDLNRIYYESVGYLGREGIKEIDSYNISTAMNTLKIKNQPTTYEIDDFIINSQLVARHSPEEYKMLVRNVSDKAFRRDLRRKLVECQGLCGNANEFQIQQKVYDTLDSVMLDYSNAKDIPEYKDVVDELFDKIEAGKEKNRNIGWEFEFPSLHEYLSIDREELCIVAATEKTGKSLLLMQNAVNLLKKGASVLYLDSELSSVQFTARLLTHLTGIPYRKIKHVEYNEEERERLLAAKEEMKTWKFTHLYMPIMTDNDIYMAFKKVMHQRGVDVFILDYIKSSSDDKVTENVMGKNYTALGNRVNLIKNTICGQYHVAGLAAVQLTTGGKIADSANIARFASSILILRDKTDDEIENDGDPTQTKALIVYRNRNGEQMRGEDYISLKFDPVGIRFSEPKVQPKREEPV